MNALYGCAPKEIESFVIAEGFPKFRAKQLLEWLYQKNALRWDEFKNLPKDLIEKLSAGYALTALRTEEPFTFSGEATTKYLFRTADDHLLESVLISQPPRQTVCVSTQLGCKVRCPFCASGKGGFVRDLTAGEIIEQVAWIARKSGQKITNVVFMGMGEPLDNFDAVMKALDILTAQWGFEMGGRKITVSTSGVSEKIYEFVKRTDGRIRLSVSLHSPDSAARDKLVPYNRKYPLAELMATLKKVHQVLKRDITFEYTLIDGVNDSEEDARGVAKLAKPLQAKINLIPYNPIRETKWKTPSEERMTLFRETLECSGVRSTFRKTVGRSTDAACGQLRLDRGPDAVRRERLDF